MNVNTKEDWMSSALEQAKKAELVGEVPVGAIIVYNNNIIAAGHNNNIRSHDPTLHAEIDVIRRAGEFFNNYRLIDCDLYVTLEPCMMCLGAMIHSRIRNLYYGASDPKTGAVGGLVDLTKIYIGNHKIQIYSGVLSKECSSMLKDFFLRRR